MRHGYGCSDSAASIIFRRKTFGNETFEFQSSSVDANVQGQFDNNSFDCHRSSAKLQRMMTTKKKAIGEQWLVALNGSTTQRFLYSRNFCAEDRLYICNHDAICLPSSISNNMKTKSNAKQHLTNSDTIATFSVPKSPQKSSAGMSVDLLASANMTTEYNPYLQEQPQHSTATAIRKIRNSPVRRHPHRHAKTRERESSAIMVARHGAHVSSYSSTGLFVLCEISESCDIGENSNKGADPNEVTVPPPPPPRKLIFSWSSSRTVQKELTSLTSNPDPQESIEIKSTLDDTETSIRPVSVGVPKKPRFVWQRFWPWRKDGKFQAPTESE